MSKTRVRLRTWTAAAVGTALLAAACGGGSASDESENVPSSSSSRPPTSSTTSGQQPTHTPEGLDVARTPPIVIAHIEGGTDIRWADHVGGREKVIEAAKTGETITLSPDRQKAVISRPGDAVRKARLEIITSATGKPVASFDLPVDSISVQTWSPDSTAFSAITRRGNVSTGMVFRVDGSSDAVDTKFSVSVNRGLWARGSTGTVLTFSSSTAPVSQLVNSKGDPVALLYQGDGATGRYGRYDDGAGTVVAFADDWQPSEACGRFGLLRKYLTTAGAPSRWAYAVYAADDDTITPLDGVNGNPVCPLSSHDGTRVAYQSELGGVTVLDRRSGTTVESARQGTPLAWSSDDKKLLVNGNGTFVVAADGSGGRQASVAIFQFCEIGTTGAVLARMSDGSAVRYDIGEDTAETLGAVEFRTDSPCETSADGRWVVAGRTVVDISNGHSSVIRAITPASIAPFHLIGKTTITPITVAR